MSTTPKPYPSDATDAEWEFLLPYLTLMRQDAPQRRYPPRDLFNAARYVVKTGCRWRFLPHDFPPWATVYQQARRWAQAGVFEHIAHDRRIMARLLEGCRCQPTAVILDGRTIQSTPEGGGRAGYDGAKKREGSKVHVAVDTLGHLLAVLVTPADEQERSQVGALTGRLQELTGGTVELAYVDQGYTGPAAAEQALGVGDPAGGDQAHRGEEGVRAAAAALGGGAELRLAGAVPPAGPRLRASVRDAGGRALARIPRYFRVCPGSIFTPLFCNGTVRPSSPASAA